MAKIRKKRLRWKASTDPNVVGYKLYWALIQGVDYDSASVNIGNVTGIVLPDNVSSFPLVAGEMELGLTAINQEGNESDMALLSARIDFSVPAPPTDVTLEDI
jgi:hypothetical protein